MFQPTTQSGNPAQEKQKKKRARTEEGELVDGLIRYPRYEQLHRYAMVFVSNGENGHPQTLDEHGATTRTTCSVFVYSFTMCASYIRARLKGGSAASGEWRHHRGQKMRLHSRLPPESATVDTNTTGGHTK